MEKAGDRESTLVLFEESTEIPYLANSAPALVPLWLPFFQPPVR